MLFPLAFSLLCLSAVEAQGPPGAVQRNTFNSSYRLTDDQINAAELNPITARRVQHALNFERSNWAGQSVSQDFYKVPKNTAHLPFGSLLKKEDYTDTNLYTVPPNVALSRFLFQSETINGTTVPASAYVLWPYIPRRFSSIKGVPVVAWGHGNSGFNAECAPSHIRNLWYQYSAPYELVLSGYAVVAPDYAGLGVRKDSEGKHINAQWLAGPPQGNDLLHAVQAARKAWPELSEEFVVMGHSQGGAAAWGAAQRQAKQFIKGYLGTIAGSPVTNLSASADANPEGLSGFLPGLSPSVGSVFPKFKATDFLNEGGLARLKLINQVQGCNSVSTQLLSYADNINPDWRNSTPYFNLYAELGSVGAKPYQGPLLILQGTADTAVNPAQTTAQVKKTCDIVSDQSLHYQLYDGVDHVPVLYASQTVWLDWIADRFKGRDVTHGCEMETIKPLRNITHYQKELNFFLEYAKWSYELA